MTLEGGDSGGGGVLAPVTKAFSGVAKAATNVVKGVVQPVYNATLKNVPGVDQALVGLDKSVGKAIPGGWGTVASVAASFIPGAQLAALGMTQAGLATGLGALTGSGVMRKGHQFNLQGAIMGGAMAYGASQLSAGLQNAADPATNATTKAIEEATKSETGQIAANLGVENAGTGIGSQARMLAEQNAGFGSAGLESIKSGANQAIQSNLINTAGNTGLSNLAANPDVFSGLAGTQQAIAQPTGLQTLGTNLTEAGKGTLSNIADAGQGIKNLTGFGPEGISGISKTATAFAEPITKTGVAAGIMGYSGMAALEEQQKFLDQQLASGNIAQAEYDTAKAKIDAQIATANQAVSESPFSSTPDRSYTKQDTLYTGTGPTDTLYGKSPSSDVSASKTLYNSGGEVKGYFGGGLLNAIAANPDFIKLISMHPGVQDNSQAQEQAAQQVGTQAVAAAPWNTAPDRSAPTVGINLYSRGSTPVEIQRSSDADSLLYAKHPEFTTKSFAVGGSVDDEYGMDEARGLNQGNLQNGLFGGGIANLAAGGMPPRFLSGGGDGMSDSIRASIEGKQEARLADGEFVIPADVVSHLGNGSSKAGAKQLYSMMDKVRQARVGTKKQGKQINPRKYLAA
jgi:hypothetical protein